MKHRVVTVMTAAMLVVGAALTDGCKGNNDDVCALPDLSCHSFQPGTDMSNADFGASDSTEGQLQAYAQATGNLAVVAGAALTNVTAACRSIAIDLGDDPYNAAGAGQHLANIHGADLLDFWCKEAKQQLAVAVQVAGQVTLSITPAKCSASIVDATSCQSRCASDGGACASTRATCAGGTIESTCTQGCSAGSAPYDCVGVCAGQCSGACTPASDAGACGGLCDGECDGTCSPTPGQTSAICSGNCLGSSEPFSCVGGTLGGGCATDSDCQANCNAAAQAAALCTPGSVVVTTFSEAPNDLTTPILIATIEKNFPAILQVVQGQGKAMATTMNDTIQGSNSLTSSRDANAAAVVCIADMVEAVTSANANFADALSGAIQISTAVGGPSGN